MKKILDHGDEPITDAQGLHINRPEFIAAILNLWITLKIILDLGPREGGYIISACSDNATTISLLSYANRTPNPLL